MAWRSSGADASRERFRLFTSPPVRGGRVTPDLIGGTRVRGPLRDSELRSLSPAERPPHPNPLPACGERELLVATPRLH